MERLEFHNGEFRILVFSDMHEHMTNPFKHCDLMNFINKSIASSKPDLVVLNGDNATAKTSSKQKKAIKKIVAPFVNYDIPYAVIFGNHDDEFCGVSKDEQLEIYQSMGKCLAVKGICETGVGNYNLLVYGENKPKLNLWFFDSNTYDKQNGGYAYVAYDQLDWYEKTANALVGENGETVEAIAFQHIPVVEEYNLLKLCDKDSSAAVRGDCGFKDGYYCIDEHNSTMEGVLLEGPCPPTVNGGEFERMKAVGDVSLMVFGHDHINTFSGVYNDICLMQAGGAGFCTYHKGISQSASLIVVNESNLSFSRKHIDFKDIIGIPLTYKFRNYKK